MCQSANLPIYSPINVVFVAGMTCSSCVHHIENHLSGKPGILSVSVALATQTGRVTFEPEQTGARDIIEAIKDLGFGAHLRTDDGQRASRYDHRDDIKRSVQGIHFTFYVIKDTPEMLLLLG